MNRPFATAVPRRRAVAAVEFCLVAGVLFVLVLGMIEISRAYEQMAKIMDSNSELSKSAVARMGKAQ